MPSIDELHHRHRLTLMGEGPVTLLFVHGLGTHQGIWRRVVPDLSAQARCALIDLAGCGAADPEAWSATRHASLEGHAQDVVEVARAVRQGPLVLVVHSIGAMIGLLAEGLAPELFDAHVMIAPAPCYQRLPDYPGAFGREAIDVMLEAMDQNLDAWGRGIAPMAMGEPRGGPGADELVAAFARCNPQALRQFARAAFLCDYRDALPRLVKPVLLVQAQDDAIAPAAVGRYMRDHLPDGRLETVPTASHFPQLDCPADCVRAIRGFLAGIGFGPRG